MSTDDTATEARRAAHATVWAAHRGDHVAMCPRVGDTNYEHTPVCDAVTEAFVAHSRELAALSADYGKLLAESNGYERERDEAREALARAANHLETAADIIRDDAGGDEEDDAEEREFIKELRAIANRRTT